MPNFAVNISLKSSFNLFAEAQGLAALCQIEQTTNFFHEKTFTFIVADLHVGGNRFCG